MANDNETVREVCAEMRGMGNYQSFSGDHARELANRIESVHEREMAEKDAEIARLKSALKPVMYVQIERIDGLDSPDGEFMTSGEYGVCDCDGNEVDNHSIADALNAVREAQRVMREGGAE